MAYSYTLSLTQLLSLLFIGGFLFIFQIVSVLLLGILIFSAIYIAYESIRYLSFNSSHLRSIFLQWLNPERIILLALSFAFLAIFGAFLISRAILDSDVVQYYLPIAREIVRSNGITYSTGYDFNILLKPMGISIIYAWNYAISGSLLLESFRLMPLIPVLILILLIYKLAAYLTGSKIIGIMAAIIFFLAPFHDRLFLYNAFYPDVFYYPLILLALYCFIRYFETKRTWILAFTGLLIGTAGLLKAQTIFVFLAFLIVIILLGAKEKGSLITLAVLVISPFLVILPNLLVEWIRITGLTVTILVISSFQIFFYLLLAFFSIFAFILIDIGLKIENFRLILKYILIFILPLVAVSSLWYLANLIIFGTLLNTSSILLPNYEWAMNILKSIQLTPIIISNFVQYLIYLSLLLFDPAILGFIWIIILLVGLGFSLRIQNDKLKLFLLVNVFILVNLISHFIFHISLTGTNTYNPRDIVIFSPLVTILASIGILYLASGSIKKSLTELKFNGVAFLFITFIGFMSLIHSVLIWFSRNTLTDRIWFILLQRFLDFVRITFAQSTYQLYAPERVAFVSSQFGTLFAVSFLITLPLICYFLVKIFKLSENRIKRFEQKIMHHRTLFEILIIGLSISVIVIPRFDIMYAQGGPTGISETQLRVTYGELYELISKDGRSLNGGILTFYAPFGMPYYLQENIFIDLRYPANLAYLKDCFTQNPQLTTNRLRYNGISYMLFNPSTFIKLDSALNGTISLVLNDTQYSQIIHIYGSWQLYLLESF